MRVKLSLVSVSRATSGSRRSSGSVVRVLGSAALVPASVASFLSLFESLLLAY